MKRTFIKLLWQGESKFEKFVIIPFTRLQFSLTSSSA